MNLKVISDLNWQWYFRKSHLFDFNVLVNQPTLSLLSYVITYTLCWETVLWCEYYTPASGFGVKGVRATFAQVFFFLCVQSILVWLFLFKILKNKIKRIVFDFTKRAICCRNCFWKVINHLWNKNEKSRWMVLSTLLNSGRNRKIWKS